MNLFDPYIVCNEILVRVQTALIDAGRRDPDNLPAAYVAAGLVDWPECCGLLVVVPERIFRAAIFPIEGPDLHACYDGLMVMQAMVLVMGCVPVIDEQGDSPTVEATNDAYHELLLDAAVVWNTVANDMPWRGLHQNQTFVGAQGGCIGAETRIMLDIDAESWCYQ